MNSPFSLYNEQILYPKTYHLNTPNLKIVGSAIENSETIGHKYTPITMPNLSGITSNRCAQNIWNEFKYKLDVKNFFDYWGRLWSLSNFEIESLVTVIGRTQTLIEVGFIDSITHPSAAECITNSSEFLMEIHKIG